GLARGIIDYTRFQETNKTFYLFDTFEGFNENYVSEHEKNNGILSLYSSHYKSCYEEVKETFKNFNVEIIKGAVPDTLNKVNIDKVSFLSIDMNCTLPEIAALNFFWDKLVSGAIVVLDDYGFAPHIEQKKAHDMFATQHNVIVLSLPTGQGIIIKP
ncbi:MAG: TylF/MycF/NovP-related O-methyltransferase, partial [Dolichospermum sp.]